MVRFVNAKINIGLQIVRRRADGYHDLQTIFYPIGLYAGTPENPEVFCDVLEILPGVGNNNDLSLHLTGSQVDCPLEKNLVYKAANLFCEKYPFDHPLEIHLDKHIPDGAGIGGGSADAAFVLSMLAEMRGDRDVKDKLPEMALQLGADCPFFLLNRAAYGAGVGERLEEISLDLSGKWLLLVKPDIYISTKDAFAGVSPKSADFDLRKLPEIPIGEWKELVHNDFEDSVFPQFPAMELIKLRLYAEGAEYASMTGSGSCLYGIYASEEEAAEARAHFDCNPTITATYLLKL